MPHSPDLSVVTRAIPTRSISHKRDLCTKTRPSFYGFAFPKRRIARDGTATSGAMSSVPLMGASGAFCSRFERRLHHSAAYVRAAALAGLHDPGGHLRQYALCHRQACAVVDGPALAAATGGRITPLDRSLEQASALRRDRGTILGS